MSSGTMKKYLLMMWISDNGTVFFHVNAYPAKHWIQSGWVPLIEIDGEEFGLIDSGYRVDEHWNIVYKGNRIVMTKQDVVTAIMIHKLAYGELKFRLPEQLK